MSPKIDYALLGAALSEYESRGWRYVEVPWMVEEAFIRETLPAPAPFIELAVAEPGRRPKHLLSHSTENCLVGSAEQGFLSLDLPPGHYVGVTPCFRFESENNLFYQTGFMKVELHLRLDRKSDAAIIAASTDRCLWDAQEVMGVLGDCGRPSVEKTEEGYDLTIGGTEVGSYGHRRSNYASWVYGTGLALPRFSVASALANIY